MTYFGKKDAKTGVGKENTKDRDNREGAKLPMGKGKMKRLLRWECSFIWWAGRRWREDLSLLEGTRLCY